MLKNLIIFVEIEPTTSRVQGDTQSTAPIVILFHNVFSRVIISSKELGAWYKVKGDRVTSLADCEKLANALFSKSREFLSYNVCHIVYKVIRVFFLFCSFKFFLQFLFLCVGFHFQYCVVVWVLFVVGIFSKSDLPYFGLYIVS